MVAKMPITKAKPACIPIPELVMIDFTYKVFQEIKERKKRKFLV